MADNMPAPAPVAGQSVDVEKQKMQEMVQSMLKQATAPRMGMGQPTQRYSEGEMRQQGYNMSPAYSTSQEVGISLQNAGTLINNLVAQHKQNQTREALSDWQSFDNAIQKAQMVAGDPSAPDFQQKMQRALGEMPYVKAMLDPSNPKSVKRLKNMYKALNVDLLDEKENVYGQALKQLHKVKAAEKKIMDTKMQQEMAQKRQQTMQARLAQLMQHAQMQAPDPKNLESAAKIIEAQMGREAAQSYREAQLAQQKQAHEDSISLQRQQLAARIEDLRGRAEDRKITMQERERHDKEMEELRKQDIQLKAELAHSKNDTSGLKEAVEQGFPINLIAGEARDKVIKEFTSKGESVPRPISPGEQVTLDDGLTQINKTQFWKDALKQQYGDASGNLPNKPLGTAWDQLKYKFGGAPPNAELISDFSRERYSAVAGLVKGIRRGDILKDMIKHTPDPVKDSPQLMYLKLDALDANYSLARAVVLQDHGFTKDPVSGNLLKDDIQSFENHLKSADGEIKKMGAPLVVPKGGEIPE